MARMERQHPIELDAVTRKNTFEEMTAGFDDERAKAESLRCLQCKHAPCRKGCPVDIDIPGFIDAIKYDNLNEAYKILKADTNLPAVCGRVCPQESQCEKLCVRVKMEGSVAIGTLERYVADKFINGGDAPVPAIKRNKTCAVVGSGPSGLTVAGDLAKAGVDVTIFEAFHEAGGVLVYGIPEFRLPKEIVAKEIDILKKMGVKIEFNTVVGKLITLAELQSQFDAVYLCNGAGLPTFMNIPGEGLNGVMSANEFLTRINLMKAYDHNSDTPVKIGRNVAVIGAGNVAMDAARTAVRLGADKVSIIYRRSEAEIPARAEEVRHAKEEGVIFNLLCNPVAMEGEDGYVKNLRCVRMQLGEPDESGRRGVSVIPNSEFDFPCDTVIVSLGTKANPVITESCPELAVDKRGLIIVDENNKTNLPNVWAGGDNVNGAATVILAMGAGKAAAKAILQHFDNNGK